MGLNFLKNNFYLGFYLLNIFGSNIKNLRINNNKNSLTIINLNIKKDFLYLFIYFLKNNINLQFKQILDIWGEDYKGIHKKYRFTVNYLLNSLVNNNRIILKVNLKEGECIESIISLYNSAGWLEREVWDMFGVFFLNHTDLRRILTDYGFDGFPLRKDFPLVGYNEIFYSYELKRIIYKKYSILNDFRLYNYKNPWIK